MHFILGGEWEKTQASFLPAAAPATFPPLSGVTGTYMLSQPYTPLLSLMAQRKSDGGRVGVGAAGRAVPTSSWGSCFDCKDVVQGIFWICWCLPRPSLPFLPSQGWHRALVPWSSGPNTSTSMGISWPWPLPPHGPSFVCQAGVVTLPPPPQPFVAHSNSCPCLSTPSHQPRWALGMPWAPG